MDFIPVERTRDLLSLEHPSKPLCHFSFRRALGNKTLSGTTVRNIRTEVYENDVIDPRPVDCVDCTDVQEPISVRLIVSGSSAAQPRLSQMVQNVCAAFLQNKETLALGSLPNNQVVVSDNAVVTVTS